MIPLLDVLSLHCPLTPSTRGLIGEAELGSMKPGSVLVNMSRGAVVDEMALAQALREKTSVMGAASDVFEVEPVRREMAQGLFELENFIGTPHMSRCRRSISLQIFSTAIPSGTACARLRMGVGSCYECMCAQHG
jgi:phosphoglycerate dehydrogenase-like enzyme